MRHLHRESHRHLSKHSFHLLCAPLLLLFFFLFFLFLFRTAFSSRTFLTQPSMFTGLVPLGSTSAQLVVDAGILLSTVLNVQLPCQLTVLCTCGKATVKICTASAILRGTVTISTKARCAWDFGLVIVHMVLRRTPTLAGTQCPGSLLKKFLNLRLRSRPRQKLYSCINAYISGECNNLIWKFYASGSFMDEL